MPMKWLPENPVWKNFQEIWTKIPLLLFFKNSFKLAIIITALQVLTSSFAAYPFAKMKFPGKDLIFLCYIATIAVPWQVYMVPQFILIRKMQLADTHLSLILMQAFTAFGVFLMRQSYLSVPNELSEAARIDGLSEFGIYWKGDASAFKIGHCNFDYLQLCQCLERLHGTNDLPELHRIENHSAWTSYVYYPVFCRLQPDYGSSTDFINPSRGSVFKYAAILYRGRGNKWSEGLINCER